MNRYIIRYYLTPERYEDNTIEAESINAAATEARIRFNTNEWLVVEGEGTLEHFRMRSIDHYVVMGEGAIDPDAARKLKAAHERMRNQFVLNDKAASKEILTKARNESGVVYSPDFLAQRVGGLKR